MEKIIALDYGAKRTGIAYAEFPLFIAHSLTTIRSNELLDYLRKITSESNVVKIVIGEPKSLDGSLTDVSLSVYKLKKTINKILPDIEVVFYDERFTSKIAQQTMILGGMKKSKRRVKENVDKIAAVVILQGYLLSNT
tara:strand:+ start:438 stop:851 length:414 start_codon:yes stop_codon:yes gene_type:complete